MNEVGKNDASGFIKPLNFCAKDDFVLLSEIPSGGFNSLFRAKLGGRLYVLKGLKPQHRADALYINLLKKEYELMVELNHPGIVRIYSLEEVPDLGSCIVMECVEGKTLDKWMKGTDDVECHDSKVYSKVRRPGFGKRLDVALQILDAMKYYHGFGIVHRDLKPGNILVNDNGKVKIIDFGLGDSSDYIDFKEPAGTDGYMAPELLENGGVVDARADIYAFGVSLKQLLPRRFRMVARRCTADNPDRRYADAAAVRGAIQGRRMGWLSVALILIAAGVLAFSGIIKSEKKATPDDVLQAMDTYRLRADILDRQADAVFCNDSLECVEEAQQMLSIFTVRYLNMIYEVLADYPEWSIAERDAFEDEAAAIMEQRVNKIGMKVETLELCSNPVFYQTERGEELAERYVVLNEHRHELANCYDERTPSLL